MGKIFGGKTTKLGSKLLAPKKAANASVPAPKAAAPKAAVPAPAPAAAPTPAAAPKPAADTSSVVGTKTLAMAAAAASAVSTVPATSTDAAQVKPILDKVAALLGPGAKFTDNGKTKWSVGDSQALLDVVARMSPQDRALLKNATFERADKIAGEPGHGGENFGDMAFQAVEAGGPMTVRIADVASRTGVVDKVLAHEIGHSVMGGGKWDANQLREFAKLSQWTRADGTIFSGYDKSHTPVGAEPGTVPKITSNLMSDDPNYHYSAESPAEDFAESYRFFTLNPQDLMAKAPEKFLFINASSGKYSAGDVQAMATAAGVDLPLVMSELRQSNLRPESLAKIASVNGLQTAGTAGSGPGDAIAAIQEKGGDPAFIASLKQNPQGALGDAIWNRLSAAEQKLLSNPAYVDKIAQQTAANKAAPKDWITPSDVSTLKDFFNWIVTTAPDNATKMSMSDDKILGIPVHKFGATPNKSPAEARFEYFNKMLHQPQFWGKLSPDMQKLLDSPSGQQGINMLANDQSMKEATKALWGGIKVKFFGTHYIGGDPDKKKIENAKRAVATMGASEIQAWTEMLKAPNAAEIKSFGSSVDTMLAQGFFKTANGMAV